MSIYDKIETRAKKLFDKRYLREAESADAEQRINEELAGKISRLETGKGRRTADIGQLAKQASELWSNRAKLGRKDLIYLAAALLYFISPIDAIPDLIPGAGYLDDLLILSSVLAMIVKGLSSAAAKEKRRLEDWIDERTDLVIDKFDEAATSGVRKAVTTVVIGLWGATTVAAISLAVGTTLGTYPANWVAYVVVSSVLVLVWNGLSLAALWRQYRQLDGQWRRRLRTLISSKLTVRHAIAVAVPIVVLAGLGLSRVLAGVG